MIWNRYRESRPVFAVGAVAAGLAGLVSTAIAQGPSMVTAEAAVRPAVVARGGSGQMTISLKIQPGWHVYAVNPGGDGYIPTTVTAASGGGVVFGKPRFPRPATMKTGVDPAPIHVYQGGSPVAIVVPYQVAKTAKPGSRDLQATVRYQTCNDRSCLPPTSAQISAVLRIK